MINKIEKEKEKLERKKKSRKLKMNVVVESMGKNLDMADIQNKVYEDYQKKFPDATPNEIKVYINVDEMMIYYVVDGIESTDNRFSLVK